uniref:Uncharacterized protein n=1 Tax=Arundo donax TaxID=35708 RepID=A0A0A9ESK6_ARUDO
MVCPLTTLDDKFIPDKAATRSSDSPIADELRRKEDEPPLIFLSLAPTFTPIGGRDGLGALLTSSGSGDALLESDEPKIEAYVFDDKSLF